MSTHVCKQNGMGLCSDGENAKTLYVFEYVKVCISQNPKRYISI